MVKIEITAGSYAEAAILLSALAASGMAIKGGASVSANAAEKQAVANVKLDLKPEASKADTAKAATPAVKAPEAAAGTLVYLDVKKAITETAKTPEGKASVIGALAKFGAKNGTELTEAQWAPFIAAIGGAGEPGDLG